MKIRALLFTALLISSVVGSGCATNRGILDIRTTLPQQPSSGEAVTIARVTDQRIFELAPSVASIPSLKDGEIDNPEIKSRAIARKRNTYGQAIGDILLPPGRTVQDVVAEALTKSFREAGYRVTTEDDDMAATATPIEADIEQFWSWFTPGFWTISLEFEARVIITADVKPFQQGEEVRGYVKVRGQAAGTKAWMNVMNQGMDDFTTNLTARLKSGEGGGE